MTEEPQEPIKRPRGRPRKNPTPLSDIDPTKPIKPVEPVPDSKLEQMRNQAKPKYKQDYERKPEPTYEEQVKARIEAEWTNPQKWMHLKGESKRVTIARAKRKIKLLSQPVINHHDMVARIAESSDYYQYEVEDVLRHLGYVVSDCLASGFRPDIKGLGLFQRKDWPMQLMHDNFNELSYLVKPKATVMFKPCNDLKEDLNWHLPDLPREFKSKKEWKKILKAKKQEYNERYTDTNPGKTDPAREALRREKTNRQALRDADAKSKKQLTEKAEDIFTNEPQDV